MKRHLIFRRPVVGLFLVLVAGSFFASNVLAQMSPVMTEIGLDIASCQASFLTTSCRGGKNPNGDICVAKGPNTQPMMIFKFKSPFPTDAKITRIDVLLNLDGSCPADVNDDFPAITSPDCYYEPSPANNTLQLKNDNKHQRVWYYYLTLELPGCTGPVVIHPLIENGGNN